ncbi:MFS transporter [Loktanella agnita]|uniref:MFS transporter n=1 Tax=Loktanella agnita TaxID=287097 RepID=UPI00398A4593
MNDSTTEQIFDAVTEARDGESDLPQKAQNAEPGSFLRHALSLGASKIADGLIDPKLVLSWLLTHLGAGTFWAGLLVPVREAGALLPQLFITPFISRATIRKWFWAGGAFVQGLSAAGIALAALTLEGGIAGAVIVALLAVLALARSVCSASYKDILGKTVDKTRRGTATGFASSAAAVGVIGFALLLMTGLGNRYVIVEAAILLAAGLWVLAAVVFSTLKEVPSEDTKDTGGLAPFSLLREHPQLTRFIVTRALLVGTALAPPYLVMLQPDGAFAALGALVLASAIASLLSSYVWGRLSDRSSRRVLQLSGLAGGVVLAALVMTHWLGFSDVPGVIPVMLFGLMTAYHGVRQGRSTHLVDMAGPDERASFTALSNTIVGLVLMGAGAGFAGLAALSVPLVLGLFAAMCFGAAAMATGLDDVQND